MGVFLWDICDKIRENRPFLGVDLQIRGQKVDSPPSAHTLTHKLLASLLDSEFHIDYEFAIKHDQIHSDD